MSKKTDLNRCSEHREYKCDAPAFWDTEYCLYHLRDRMYLIAEGLKRAGLITREEGHQAVEWERFLDHQEAELKHWNEYIEAMRIIAKYAYHGDYDSLLLGDEKDEHVVAIATEIGNIRRRVEARRKELTK